MKEKSLKIFCSPSTAEVWPIQKLKKSKPHKNFKIFIFHGPYWALTNLEQSLKEIQKFIYSHPETEIF